MPDLLTRQGALNITSTINDLANAVQFRFALLGIPEDVALDFAKRADMLSDTIETTAVTNFPLTASDEEEDEDEGSDKEAGCEKLPEGGMRDNCEKKKEEGGGDDKKEEDKDDKKPDFLKEKEEKKTASPDFPVQPGKDETGLSVDHGNAGFDANAIADDRGGPRQSQPDEGYMAGHFSQSQKHDLRDRVEGGTLPSVGSVDSKLASLVEAIRSEILKAASEAQAVVKTASVKVAEAPKEAKVVEASEANDWGFNLTK